jgi:t-SNARE complex subunit (syntaxin)
LVFQEIEKKIKELQQACDDMKKGIVQRQLEVKTLKEDLDTSNRQVSMDSKEYEKLTEKMENLKVSIYHSCIIQLQCKLEIYIF